ncbi:MAG TPA: ABC transporter substrate-binding protein [Streptosporangiaceae bacterium]|nr:ABC transporter substrate-binding protein [Streptosporangiaceae bacterium]
MLVVRRVVKQSTSGHAARRVAVLAAAPAAALVLAACGASTNSAASGTGSGSSAPGVTSNSILFGQTVPKTGPAALYGESTAGAQAYFDYVNAHGGVHGRRVKLISLDDQYQPPVALQDTRTLVNTDKVFAEVAVNGTATTQADITVLDPANVPVIGVQTGATVFAGTLRKNLYNVWPSYLTEGNLLGSFAQSLHVSKVGVLYQNDDFGKSLLQGVTNSGLRPTMSVSYDPTQTDFSPQAAQFKAAHVGAVIILAIPGPTTDFLNALNSVNFKPVRIMSQVSAIPQMFSTAPQEFPGSYIGAFIPPLANSTDPQVKSFLSAMSAYQPGAPASVFAAWGWTEAQVAVAGLKVVKGTLTRDSYEAALNTLSSLQTLGGSVSYSSSNHSGISHMFMVKAQGGNLVSVTG